MVGSSSTQPGPPLAIGARMVAAGMGGCIAEMVTIPLDTAKVRLQVQGEGGGTMRYRGLLGTITTIVRQEGPNALYSGISAGLQRQMAFASVRVGLYDNVKGFYNSLLKDYFGKTSNPGVTLRIAAGVSTGGMAVLFAQPTDVVKIRMQAQSKGKGPARYTGAFNAYRTILKEEGVRRGLWKVYNSWHNQPWSRKKSAIIVSRYQSGSTFVGNLFNNNPEIFYIYEPLHALFLFKVNISAPTLGFRKHLKGNNASLLKQRVLTNSLLCKSDRFYPLPKYKQQGMLFRQMKAVQRFSACTAPVMFLNVFCNKLSHTAFAQNSKILYPKACSQYKTAVAKTIRTSIVDAEAVLYDRRLDAKIIHLVRDPRAMINAMRWYTIAAQSRLQRQRLAAQAKSVCKAINDDYEAGEKLKQLYPDKYMRIRYEDVLNHPVVMTETLYRFLGMDIHPDVKGWVKKATSKGFALLHTRRAKLDSADEWRNRMTQDALEIIEVVCYKLLMKLDYELYTINVVPSLYQKSIHFMFI